MTGSWNMALWTAGQRQEIEARKAECLDRYRAAQELACQIHAQRRDKGNGWWMWAKLNRLVKGQASE